MQNIFDFRGKSNRKQFLFYTLGTCFLFFLAYSALPVETVYQNAHVATILNALLLLILTPLVVRRLNHMSWSPWWVLVFWLGQLLHSKIFLLIQMVTDHDPAGSLWYFSMFVSAVETVLIFVLVLVPGNHN